MRAYEHHSGLCFETPSEARLALSALENQAHFMRRHRTAPTIVRTPPDWRDINFLRGRVDHWIDIVPAWVDVPHGWHMLEGLVRQSGLLLKAIDYYEQNRRENVFRLEEFRTLRELKSRVAFANEARPLLESFEAPLPAQPEVPADNVLYLPAHHDV